MNGFLNIIKPPGMTSSDAVVRVRRMLPKGIRVGHMGTLDPDALGVLPIGVGKAARLFDEVIDKDKTYIAEMRLGIATDTQDASGTVTAQSTVNVTCAALENAALRFTGEIMQIPPAYSAVKKDGKRLYALAREGLHADVPPRPARVDSIRVLSFRGKRALLEIKCGRGTYIRTLLHDMGEALGCHAHMAYLVRSASGPFTMANGLSLDACRRAFEKDGLPLLPMDMPLGHLPRADFSEAYLHAVRNGNPLPAPSGLPEGAKCRVYLCGAFAGIAKESGGILRFQSMLWEAPK